jgi:hypothetical protein
MQRYRHRPLIAAYLAMVHKTNPIIDTIQNKVYKISDPVFGLGEVNRTIRDAISYMGRKMAVINGVTVLVDDEGNDVTKKSDPFGVLTEAITNIQPQSLYMTVFGQPYIRSLRWWLNLHSVVAIRRGDDFLRGAKTRRNFNSVFDTGFNYDGLVVVSNHFNDILVTAQLRALAPRVYDTTEDEARASARLTGTHMFLTDVLGRNMYKIHRKAYAEALTQILAANDKAVNVVTKLSTRQRILPLGYTKPPTNILPGDVVEPVVEHEVEHEEG